MTKCHGGNMPVEHRTLEVSESFYEYGQCITRALRKHQAPMSLARLFLEILSDARYSPEEVIEFSENLAGLSAGCLAPKVKTIK